MSTVQKLGFYATPPHDCNYLSDQKAVTLFADPNFPKNTRLYTALADCGFRRSGEHLYMPHCNECSACISVRIPVHEFIPSQNQKRCLRYNKDIKICEVPATFKQKHFELYKQYLQLRHPGGGMDNPTPDSYMKFLTADWADTLFYEMYLERNLIAVAVVDELDNGMSAVYTFFDPNYSKRSLGKFAILFQIERVKQLGLQWLYLGYWIKQCGKMNYKIEYQPMEYFVADAWSRERPSES